MDIRSVSSSPAAAPLERDPGAARSAAVVKAPVSHAPVAPPSAATASTSTSAATGASKGANGKVDPLDEAISNINKSLQAANQGVEFSVDDDSKRLVVKVVDQETREVLRQMPTKEALEIARSLDRNKGMLIKLEA
jgi:flagellar protein FlaG